MKRILCTTVCLSLLCLPLPARAEPGAETAAVLEVDTSELGTIGPILRDRLLERGSQVLRDRDIAAGRGGDPVVRVTVRALDGEDPGFQYELRIVTSTDPAGEVWSEDCSLCTEAELIEGVAAQLGKAATSLQALAPEAEPEPTASPPPPVLVETPESGAPTDDESEHAGLDIKAKVGIGILATGVLAVGAGVGLVLAPAKPLPDDPLRERYTQPPGYAMLAVGGAALVTGAVLLGLGLRGRRRATARHARPLAIR